jgi:hypothetical protein
MGRFSVEQILNYFSNSTLLIDDVCRCATIRVARLAMSIVKALSKKFQARKKNPDERHPRATSSNPAVSPARDEFR